MKDKSNNQTIHEKHSYFNHGETKSKEYAVWQRMKSRCYCVGNTSYRNYGGRGIEICERWRNSFSNFLEDMGRKPINHVIDKDKLNKCIHEELFGECWHEWESGINTSWDSWYDTNCKVCKAPAMEVCDFKDFGSNPDYTSNEMFIPLWEKLKEQRLLEEIVNINLTKYTNYHHSIKFVRGKKLSLVEYALITLINPPRLTELIVSLLKEKESHE